MRIAAPDILLELDGRTFALRPSVGAAIRLAYRYDSFAHVMKGVAEGRIGVIADVIAETSARPLSEVRAALAPPLNRCLFPAIEACVAVITALTDLGGNDGESGNTGTPMSFTDGYQHLFEVACGAIGWTAEAALSATPAQIIIAYKGRVELLKAIFGSAEDGGEAPKAPHFERDEEGFAALRAMSLSGANGRA